MGKRKAWEFQQFRQFRPMPSDSGHTPPHITAFPTRPTHINLWRPCMGGRNTRKFAQIRQFRPMPSETGHKTTFIPILPTITTNLNIWRPCLGGRNTLEFQQFLQFRPMPSDTGHKTRISEQFQHFQQMSIYGERAWVSETPGNSNNSDSSEPCHRKLDTKPRISQQFQHI